MLISMSTSTSTSLMKLLVVFLILSTMNGYKVSRISMSTIDKTKQTNNNEYGKKIVTEASKVYLLLIASIMIIILCSLLLLYDSVYKIHFGILIK